MSANHDVVEDPNASLASQVRRDHERACNARVAMRAGGFSLIELMIVLAILVTLAAIAVPNLQRNFQRNELRDAGRLLQETLGEWRQQAMQSGRPIYIQLGWDTNSIRVHRDAAWQAAWTTVIRSSATNDAYGVRIEDGNLKNPPEPTETSAEVSIDGLDGDASRTSGWEVQQISLTTDVRFRQHRLQPLSGIELESSRDETRGQVMNTTENVAGVTNEPTIWSQPLAIMPDGSVEEVHFWLELEQRWQCPVLWRGATGQLEIGPVQVITEGKSPTERRETL
ncbi:MAG: prepilin-type N-terminal cleavage/methylation domain-containing protein [Planctomycetaceae bacterium]|nr:prepilin-type N-terminal cleavage/methylation domain-containing protein [Planctomycetaceae bacterium]